MLLDVPDVLAHWLPVSWLLLAILAGKFVIVLGTALVLRLPLNVAILSAATLSQVGEFSFVLLKAASGTDLLTASFSHMLLVAIVLSMLLTPLAIRFGPHLASGSVAFPGSIAASERRRQASTRRSHTVTMSSLRATPSRVERFARPFATPGSDTLPWTSTQTTCVKPGPQEIELVLGDVTQHSTCSTSLAAHRHASSS